MEYLILPIYEKDGEPSPLTGQPVRVSKRRFIMSVEMCVSLGLGVIDNSRQ